MENKQYVVYILTNDNETTLYVGVTGDLSRRLVEHQEKLIEGFTSAYQLQKLVYYEVAENPEVTIAREKQLKKWSRKKKEWLISVKNPHWNDLRDVLFGPN